MISPVRSQISNIRLYKYLFIFPFKPLSCSLLFPSRSVDWSISIPCLHLMRSLRVILQGSAGFTMSNTSLHRSWRSTWDIISVNTTQSYIILKGNQGKLIITKPRIKERNPYNWPDCSGIISWLTTSWPCLTSSSWMALKKKLRLNIVMAPSPSQSSILNRYCNAWQGKGVREIIWTFRWV